MASEDVAEVEVDLDLDAQDAVLRADVGKPTTIRLKGKVITFPPMDLWDYIDARKMSIGDYSGWARGVLSEPDFVTWVGWELKNFQIGAIVQRITLQAGLSLGKSSSSSVSSGGSSRKPKRT